MMQLFGPLMDVTLATSLFETRRDYVSLSNIFKPVKDLLNDYYNGYTADEDAMIKCRLGYWMEKGMKERLLKIEGVEDSFAIVVPGSNGLIKGHPDFKFLGLPGDCKSYACDDHMPDERRIPKKIYWQMNAYMLYTGVNRSVLVCESRESGKFKTILVLRNHDICDQIREKVNTIISIL